MDPTITSREELRTIYREPRRPDQDQLDHLDGHCRTIIGLSPFIVLSTADGEGNCDVSPKGGPPGFVKVLDDTHLAIPDLSGNNKLHGLQNLLENSGIAVLFVIPGVDETLRVNGRATISTDADVRAACAIDGKTTKVALVVETMEVYTHCAKAFRRGGLWKPETWPDTSCLPSYGTILRDHMQLNLSAAEIDEALEANYEQSLWLGAGEDPHHDR